MNQRVKGMKENAANRHCTQHLPRVRQVLAYKDDERSLSLREYAGYSGRRHDACANNIQMKYIKCVVGTHRGHCRPLQIHTGASLSPDLLRTMYYMSHGCTACNNVALTCCVGSLLTLYFHQPGPEDLF